MKQLKKSLEHFSPASLTNRTWILHLSKSLNEPRHFSLLSSSVGVSNFGVQHLEGLKAAGLPKPSVNQIELHPWRQFKDIVAYCRKEGVAVEGYSPLVKGERLEEPRLLAIAKKWACFAFLISEHRKALFLILFFSCWPGRKRSYAS